MVGFSNYPFYLTNNNTHQHSQLQNLILRFQVTTQNLCEWCEHPKFETKIIGFFVRIDINGKNVMGVGKIEGKQLIIK